MPVNIGLLVSTPEAKATTLITSFRRVGSIDRFLLFFGKTGSSGKSFELLPLNLD